MGGCAGLAKGPLGCRQEAHTFPARSPRACCVRTVRPWGHSSEPSSPSPWPRADGTKDVTHR